MKCVICEKSGSDNGFDVGVSYDSVTCARCRAGKYPSFLSKKQYKRYWHAFHTKWRWENK